MALILIEQAELQAMLLDMQQPILKELQVLRNIIESDGKPLTVKEFATKSGYGVTKVREMITAGKIGYNQTTEGGKITIPSSELIKVKQL